MYRIHRQIIGKADGNFKPLHNKPEIFGFLDNLEHQLNIRHINKVFSPHCQLTTNVAQAGEVNNIKITDWFIRTPPGFDGGMITKPGTAIALFNADCPAIALFDNKRGQLALLHGGFRCLVPTMAGAPNIINQAFQKFRLNPSLIEAYISFGAGSCCYGIDHLSELDRIRVEPFLSYASKGPRKREISVDLFSLARAKLLEHGIKAKNITVNDTCTACANRMPSHPEGDYYSNIYEGSLTGRNIVLAWFTDTCLIS